MQRGFGVARAAALLLIASGASGAVSAVFPALDERWIFVAAIAAIAALEGFLVGLISIWAAAGAHMLLSGGDSSLIVYAGTVAVIAGGVLSRRPSPAPLPPVQPPPPGDVEDELAKARARMVETDRKLGERISELEADLASRDAAVTRQLARIAEMDAHATQQKSQHDARIAALESRLTEKSARVSELEAQVVETTARIGKLSTELAQRTVQASDAEARIAQMRSRSEDGEREAAERSERDTARISDLEAQLADATTRAGQLQSRVADLEHESAKRSERDTARISELEAQLAAITTTSAARIGELEPQLADATTHAGQLQSRVAHLEHESAERSERDAARIAGLEAQLAASMTTSAARIAELEPQLAEATTHAGQLQSRVADLERESAERVAQLVSELAETTGHSAQLQLRIHELERESAGRTARDAARISELETQLAETLTACEATDAALVATRAASASLASRIAELEEAIDAADSLLDTQRHAHEEHIQKLDREWTEKLNTIVAHLAGDHEADMGEALLEREAARAEVRELRRLLEEKHEKEHGFALVNSGGAKKRNVLLVHREAMLRTMAKAALERSGYRVVTADDGLEALKIAVSAQPDVILADVQMAKIDGRAFVQLLKSRPETVNVKIVLIGATSGNDPNSDFRADGFLADASNVAELKATLDDVLAAR